MSSSSSSSGAPKKSRAAKGSPKMNMQFDAADAMRDRYQELLSLALRSGTLDLDGDGVVHSGEEDLRRSGGSKTDFRASYKGYTKSENDDFFKIARGMRH